MSCCSNSVEANLEDLNLRVRISENTHFCIPIVPVAGIVMLAMAMGQAKVAQLTDSTLPGAFSILVLVMCGWFSCVYGPCCSGRGLSRAALRSRWEQRFLFAWRLLFSTFTLVLIVDDHRRAPDDLSARLRLLPMLAPHLIIVYGSLGALHSAMPIPRDELIKLLAVQATMNLLRCLLVVKVTHEWELAIMGVYLGSGSSVLGYTLIRLAGWRIDRMR